MMDIARLEYDLHHIPQGEYKKSLDPGMSELSNLRTYPWLCSAAILIVPRGFALKGPGRYFSSHFCNQCLRAGANDEREASLHRDASLDAENMGKVVYQPKTRLYALTLPIPVAKFQPGYGTVAVPYAVEYIALEVDSTPFGPEGM